MNTSVCRNNSMDPIINIIDLFARRCFRRRYRFRCRHSSSSSDRSSMDLIISFDTSTRYCGSSRESISMDPITIIFDRSAQSH